MTEQQGPQRADLNLIGMRVNELWNDRPKIEEILRQSYRNTAQNEEILRRLALGDKKFDEIFAAKEHHHNRISTVEGTISGRDNLPGLAQKVDALVTAHETHKGQVRLAASIAGIVAAIVGAGAAIGSFLLGVVHLGGSAPK